MRPVAARFRWRTTRSFAMSQVSGGLMSPHWLPPRGLGQPAMRAPADESAGSPALRMRVSVVA
jgi:hypothetical protein